MSFLAELAAALGRPFAGFDDASLARRRRLALAVVLPIAAVATGTSEMDIAATAGLVAAIALAWRAHRPEVGSLFVLRLGCAILLAGLCTSRMVGVREAAGVLMVAGLAGFFASLPDPPSSITVARPLDKQTLWLVVLSASGMATLRLLGLGGRGFPVLVAVLLVTSALLHARARALFLGSRERFFFATTALGLGLAAATTAVVLVHDSLAWVLVCVSALVVAEVLQQRRPEEVGQLTRLAASMFAFGLPPTVGVSLMAYTSLNGYFLALLTATVGLIAGTYAARKERSFLRDEGRLLQAIDHALGTLRKETSTSALAQALSALRRIHPLASRSAPELWRAGDADVLTVNAAGYLETVCGRAIPSSILALAQKEPLGILRLEVLEAVEVRRPDLREALQWMYDRKSSAVVAVMREGTVEAILALPREGERIVLLLEEATALQELGATMRGVLDAQSTEERRNRREEELRQQVNDLADAATKEHEEMHLRHRRDLEALRALACQTEVGNHSPAIRDYLSRLTELWQARQSFVLVHSAGAAPLPTLARAHIASARDAEPFALIDGTRAIEHSLARWSSRETSPLAFARGGVLVVLASHVLPEEVQQLLASFLNTGRVPWEAPGARHSTSQRSSTQMAPTQIVLLAPHSLASTTLGLERTDPLAELEFPRLSDRHEDIRALLADRLAHEGLRLRAKPLGLTDEAFRELVDYTWPANDLELLSVSTRLAQVAEGESVHARDVITVMNGRHPRD